MAHSTRDLLGAMIADADLTLEALRVDGGAAANDWMMQFQADLLGVPVERPDNVETTALGAAALAGLALGPGARWTSFSPGGSIGASSPACPRQNGNVTWRAGDGRFTRHSPGPVTNGRSSYLRRQPKRSRSNETGSQVHAGRRHHRWRRLPCMMIEGCQGVRSVFPHTDRTCRQDAAAIPRSTTSASR
jgi:hypothetical protein